MPATILYANEFRHPSEREAARALAASLPADAVAVANYVLPDAYGGYEVDFVVIVPEGVVCLEVKSWHGTIDRVGAFIEFANGYRVRSPFDGLKYKHKCIRSLLVERRLVPESLAVGSALVTRGRLDWPASAVADRYVLSVDDLHKRGALLRALEHYQRGLRLSAKDIRMIGDELKAASSGLDYWRIGAFVIDEKLSETEFAQVFLGRAAEVLERDVMLRYWQIDPLADEAARASTLRKVRHEAGALARLERARCPAIPVVYDAFVDPGDFNLFWVAHESIGSTSLTSCAKRAREDRAFAASVLEQIDDALAVLRENRIVHRGIRPEAIYVGDDDHVLLTGFEFSSTEDGTLRRTEIGDRPPGSPAARSHADDLRDVASMALAWYRLGAGDTAKKVGGLRRGSLRTALGELLDPEPSRRAADLKALVAAIRAGARE